MNILKPEDVTQKKAASELEKAKTIPQWVYDIFNEMILEKYNEETESSTIYLNALKERVYRIYPETPDEWFNVEPMYRENGWIVEFHKGWGYRESESCYDFKKGGS